VTIVSEDSPYCSQSGRVRRIFWRGQVPWVVLRLRLGGIVAVPWASTDLLTPPLEVDLGARRLLPRSCLQLPYEISPASFCNVQSAIELKNIVIYKCSAIFLRATEFTSPMSRRRASNRRELLLPLRMPDRYPTGIVFEPCVLADSTEAIQGRAEKAPEAPTRHATHCRPARQATQTAEGATAALIAANHLLAQLVFQRIRPRTRRERTSEQASSPAEIQRSRPPIAPPVVAAPAVTCADMPVPAPIPPEVQALFTDLARRRLRRRAPLETR
jgi:hypothetical protein